MPKPDEWLDPWQDQFLAHSSALRMAIDTKDPALASQAAQEHLTAMISLRNEVASLPIPTYGYGYGLAKTIMNRLMGMTPEKELEICQDAKVKVWGELIQRHQRDLKKLESGRR